MSDYQPGVYAKGDTQKVAHNQRQAVALVFQGYKRVEDEQVQSTAEPLTDDELGQDAEPDEDPVDSPVDVPSKFDF